MKKVAIVGAGLGALACAITLANKGIDVTIYEKNDHVGGKMMPVHLDGYSFDFGPNTITMPHVFQQVIAQTGRNPDDYFQFIKLDRHTDNRFLNGGQLSFTANQQEMIRQLKTLDPEGANNYPAFIKEITRLYRLAEKHFFHATFDSVSSYLSPALGLAMLQVRPFETLHKFFSRYFKNPSVLKAFNRYATYIGSSPYQTPATFAMIAYLELVEGVYTVSGGNVRIAEGFRKVTDELGVRVHTGCHVTKLIIKNKRVTGVVVKGEQIEYDAVLVNGDMLSAYPDLVDNNDRSSFSNDIIKSFDPSTSAIVLLAGVKGRTHLAHHTVFFSDQYANEFKSLTSFKYAKMPTIYICNPAATEPERFPNGDALFILANAPAFEKPGQVDTDWYKRMMLTQLEKFGVLIERDIVVSDLWTPERIADTFCAYRGALYGPSSNTKKQAFFRPKTKSVDLDGLYFVGGSTHPGGGSPMVTIGGMNVAKQILSL